MSNRKVKLKNKEGDYLHPYTDNIPYDTTVTSGSQKFITSGAVYTAVNNVTTAQNSLKTELTSKIATAKQEAINEAKFKYSVVASLPSSVETDRFYFVTG